MDSYVKKTLVRAEGCVRQFTVGLPRNCIISASNVTLTPPNVCKKLCEQRLRSPKILTLGKICWILCPHVLVTYSGKSMEWPMGFGALW